MGGFNLPPGCSVSDIPGNRPEDEREEAFMEALDAKVEQEGLKLPEEWYEGDLWRLVVLARDLGYDQGFGEGRDEERMAQADAEMAKHEGER